jgi:ribosomal protein S9
MKKNFAIFDYEITIKIFIQKIAGLLNRDARNKERKKPGQEGARRKYTWY